MQRECLMSRIGPGQTVLPNRISCLCVESIRRIRRTPVFGVRGAASARSALSFRCKQVCLDSFFTRNTLVAGFFCPIFRPLPPVRAAPPRLVTLSHSTHFGSAQNLRIFTYPKSRSKRSRYSSENDVLIEKSVKYTDFFLLSIVYV